MIRYIATLWLGMALASFIATLAKFKVESLSYAVALDVGRVTFNWFYVAEAVLLCLLFVAYLLQGRKLRVLLILIVLILVFALQVGILKPMLDLRVDAVLNGLVLVPSNIHRVYGGLELIKLAGLVFLSKGFD